MKINLKVRLKNKTWLIAFLFAIVEIVYHVAQIFGFSLPVDEAEVENTIELIVGLFVALGVVIDPTTKGVNDSERAMNYDELG